MNENLFELFRRHFPTDLGRTFLERPDGSVLSAPAAWRRC
jgi:hypothetical protein